MAEEKVCSFCGRPIEFPTLSVRGRQENIYICEECARWSVRLMEETNRTMEQAQNRNKAHRQLERLEKPVQIKTELDKYVVGQENAKKILSIAVYNHYKRVKAGMKVNRKANILLIGPTGSGKTLLSSTIARLLDVPFVLADCTSLTQAGYVGNDVETLLEKLLLAADGDVEKAQKGIVFLDEIDKIARRGEGGIQTKDPAGEGVQQALLKLLEGTEVSISDCGNGKSMAEKKVVFDTSQVLFICGGAFPGLSEIIRERKGAREASLGFGARVRAKEDRLTESQLLGEVTTQDLTRFGLLPELTGRLPVIAPLQELSEEEMVHVLTDVKGGLVDQYTEYFAMDGVRLAFSKEALRGMAHQARICGTGARGLQSIFEKELQDLMYELPSMEGVTQCIIGPDGRPELIHGEGQAQCLEKRA